MSAGPPSRADLLEALEVPLIAAPMAGGPSSPELAIAVSRAGGLGMLAGGYKTVEALGEQIARVREELGSGGSSTGSGAAARPAFGVNIFTPESAPTDAPALAAFRERWVEAVTALDDRLGRQAAEQPVPGYTDDGWAAKIELLLREPVPLVSFTFGLPSERIVRDLQGARTAVVASVASVEEALRAAQLRPDALVVQGPEAGGHRATLVQNVVPGESPLTTLLPQTLAALAEAGRELPVIAAGGIATREQAASLLAAGAVAVQVGTLFVVAEEAGTNATHRKALLDAAGEQEPRTVVTRAFSGRPARALATAYTEAMARHEIAGYPEINTLAGPIRAAAAASGRPELVHLWSGTGVAACRQRPAAEIVDLFRGLTAEQH